jgi:CHAD domain-containing protein
MSGDDPGPRQIKIPTGGVSRPVKAKRIELDRDGGIAKSFAALVGVCLAHMQGNEAGLLAGRNPEFLHQIRVGLRRLRSAFRTYRPVLAAETYVALTIEMSWLSGVLGAARDWDVFVDETVTPIVRSESTAAGLVTFRRRCAERRRHHRQAARQAVNSARYTSLKLEVERLISMPLAADNDKGRHLITLAVTKFAARRLKHHERRVHRLANDLDTADAAQRHRLRIAAKKLRYTVEFFQSLFERKSARIYAAALAEMQDTLGKLNDCATARRLLECVPHGLDAKVDARTRALLLGSIAAQERQCLVALDIGCRKWRAQARFWEDSLSRK